MPKAPAYWHVQGCDDNGKWDIISHPCQNECQAQIFAANVLCLTNSATIPPAAVWIVNPHGEFYRWTIKGPDQVEFTFIGSAIHWHKMPSLASIDNISE